MRRAPAHYPQYPPMDYRPPEPHRGAGSVISTISTVVLTLAAVVAVAVFVLKVTGGVFPFVPGGIVSVTVKPTVGAVVAVAGADTRRPPVAAPAPGIAAQEEAAAEVQVIAAQAEAPVQAPVIEAPAGVDTLGQAIPTAIVRMATAIPIEQVRVIPIIPTVAPTLIPTVAPTFIPTAEFTLSPDGKCIEAARDGKRWQVCQEWKYARVEMATVANLIRGGVLPGVEVR